MADKDKDRSGQSGGQGARRSGGQGGNEGGGRAAEWRKSIMRLVLRLPAPDLATNSAD